MGGGYEITAIDDDRFLGKTLKALLERLGDTLFDLESLAETVKDFLNAPAGTGKSLRGELVSGALGTRVYRQIRFLHCADADSLVEWVRDFVSTNHPARIGKSNDSYGIVHAENLMLRLRSFELWLDGQAGAPDNAMGRLPTPVATELPEPNAEKKQVARELREKGETLKGIAAALEISVKTVGKWCKPLKSPKVLSFSTLLTIFTE